MMEGRVSPPGVLGLRRVGARGLQFWGLAAGDWELFIHSLLTSATSVR